MNILEAMSTPRVETPRQRGERFARDRRARRRAEKYAEIEPYRKTRPAIEWPPPGGPDDLPF